MGWPITTERLDDGSLAFGGVSAPELVARHGSPLYLFDEATLRANARRFKSAFAAVYSRSRVSYAAKANASPAILAILREEGLALDVVSGGEIVAGLAAGFPASAMTFHGNNKSATELEEALTAGVGLIAVDNEHEIDLLRGLTANRPQPVAVMPRLNPALEVETHAKMRTGALDSKFGFPIVDGQALRAAGLIASLPSLDLAGYHVHLGSQLIAPEPMRLAIAAILEFAADVRERHGIAPRVISPGGGFGVADDASTRVDVESWARAAASAVRDGCDRLDLPLPELIVEPGRAIVGPAGVALYTVGARKTVPGVRTYVSVDGGMADNIRPALYGATYTAAVANRASAGLHERVTIAGKYCESGDLLIPEIELPRLWAGDLLAVPMAGAYCLAMASNYNMAPRPAVVIVADGQARLMRRRESYADLLAQEIYPLPAMPGPGRPESEDDTAGCGGREDHSSVPLVRDQARRGMRRSSSARWRANRLFPLKITGKPWEPTR